MVDPPFPISHLHEGEQDRIREGQFNPYELSKLRQGENPWPRPKTAAGKRASEPRGRNLLDGLLDRLDIQKREEVLAREEALRSGDALSAPPPFQKRVYLWLKKYAGWAFVGAATVMASLGEYAVGIALLLLAFVAFAIQIYEWSGHVQRRWLLGLVKGVWLLGVVGMLLFFGAVFYKMKASKPWSNLLAHNEEDVGKTGPLPSPAGSASPLTPTPSVSPFGCAISVAFHSSSANERAPHKKNVATEQAV